MAEPALLTLTPIPGISPITLNKKEKMEKVIKKEAILRNMDINNNITIRSNKKFNCLIPFGIRFNSLINITSSSSAISIRLQHTFSGEKGINVIVYTVLSKDNQYFYSHHVQR